VILKVIGEPTKYQYISITNENYVIALDKFNYMSPPRRQY
jgi:hypothetical protein